MTDAARHRARVRAQFGATAGDYVASPGHAAGDDLARLTAWAAAAGGPSHIALDVATGGGHTALALAPHVGTVIAADLTPQMLAAAAGLLREGGAANVAFARADAEALPFADASLDLVSCRIAPHHFADVAAFVGEVARVLRPGGTFLLEDNIVPEDPALDAWINETERLRDPTHIRSLTATAWRTLFAAAGLTIAEEAIEPKTHPFENWMSRANVPPERRAAIERRLRDAPPAARAALALDVAPDGRIVAHADHKILLRGVKGR